MRKIPMDAKGSEINFLVRNHCHVARTNNTRTKFLSNSIFTMQKIEKCYEIPRYHVLIPLNCQKNLYAQRIIIFSCFNY